MIFLASTSADPGQVMAAGLADDVQPLTDGLLGIDTNATRSQLYHGLKRLQPAAAPLLVAELTEPPKVKAMAPGAVAWFRRRFA